MHRHRLLALLTWPVALAVLAGLFALAYFVHGEMQEKQAREASGDTVQSPERAKDGVVDLGVEIAETYGLKEEPALTVQWAEHMPVYGRVVPNPRATVEVRSPFAGTLRAASDTIWPSPGQWVKSGQVLGWVDIRVGPQERLSLLNTLSDASHKYQGAREVLQIQQDRVDRLKKLASPEVISRKELDDALVALADAKTQVAATRASVELYEKALGKLGQHSDGQTSLWNQPLTAPADGEVTQLAGRPGMTIEAGGLVAQLVDSRRPLVRLDIPPQLLAQGPPPRVPLYAIPATPPASRSALSQPEPAEPPPVEATLAGPAPHLEVASQFVSYWYDVNAVSSRGAAQNASPGGEGVRHPNAVWRPGLEVKAYVKAPAAQPRQAVSVPATAVLYHQGQAFVYVRREPGVYQRREVRLLGREGERWVLAPPQTVAPQGVRPGEAVVSRQAQVLLSEEFRIGVGKG